MTLIDLIGMAYLSELEPRDQDEGEDPLILELGYLPEKRCFYISAFHLMRRKPYAREEIGKWDLDKPFHISQLARFWGNVTGDDETVERLLEIHDESLTRREPEGTT